MNKVHTIYRISNTVNDKVYIGMTSLDIGKRLSGHIKEANAGHPRPLCRAIRKHGAAAFTICPLLVCTGRELAGFYERRAIAAYNAQGKGYNATYGGEGGRGHTMSPEGKAILSARLLGKKQSPELIERRIAPLRGRAQTPELIEQRIAPTRGRKRSPEAVANMIAARWPNSGR